MSTNQVLNNYYKKEELKKIKRWWQDGKTEDEILRLVNRKYVTEEEIKETLEIAKTFTNNSNEKEDEIVEEELIVDEEEVIENDETNKIIMIADSSLEDFENQPFKLYDEDKKKEMIESIRINGIMQPLIVRPIKNEKFQILAGHNRRICGREVGLKSFPCIVKEGLTDDEALIYLIDTNLCTREKISTMERAKAYKIKYDTYKRRNINASIVEEVKKDNSGLRERIIKEEKSSNGTIQRYLRLTYLIPRLQKFVDENKISINVGESLSFLTSEEQRNIAELLSTRKIKLTTSIIKEIRTRGENRRKENEYDRLSPEEIMEIIKNKGKPKAEIITISFSKDEILRYFADCENTKEIKECILKWANMNI